MATLILKHVYKCSGNETQITQQIKLIQIN